MRRALTALLVGALLTLVGCRQALQEAPPTPEPEWRIALSHESVRLAPGERVRLRAAVHDLNGSEAGVEVKWRSLNQELGVIDSSGWLTALASEGEFEVEASAGGATATLPVSLVPAMACRAPRGTEAKTAQFVGVQVLQVVEAAPGGRSLVAGRDLIVRAGLAVRAGAPTDLQAGVTVTVRSGGRLMGRVEAEAPRCLPNTSSLGNADTAFTATIPGEWVKGELELEVEALVEDPSGTQRPLAWEGELLRYGVADAPLFEIEFVPLSLGEGAATAAFSEEQVGEALRASRALLPLGEVVSRVRTPVLITPGDHPSGILPLLREMRLLEGSSAYYHGLFPNLSAGDPFAGMAAIGGHVSWSKLEQSEGGPAPATFTIAHEFGHNLGLRHAPCGAVEGVDADYPHFNARTGSYGWDGGGLLGGEPLVQPDAADLMSYCSPKWISNHNFSRAFTHLQLAAEAARSPSSAGTLAGAGTHVSLLVSGDISGGLASLRPGFTTGAPAQLPPPGAWEWRLLDAAGAVLLSVPFEPEEETGGASRQFGFAFSVPVTPAQLRRSVSAAVVSPDGSVRGMRAVGAPGGEFEPLAGGQPEVRTALQPDGGFALEWNAEKYPAALLRNESSGELLARSSTGKLRLDLLDLPPGRYELILSNGLYSVAMPIGGAG